MAARIVAEEHASRRHVVIALSGAHAYGFPSPDSDLDLKGVHLEPAHRLLGLAPPAPSVERMEVVDGVEIDYSSNEVLAVLQGILRGNGNYVERVLGSRILLTSPEHETLVPVVRRALSRRLHRHYRGFATGQLRELCSSPAPTVKQVLYVLRTALTGAHVLLTGQVVPDLTLLCDEHGFEAARELIKKKRAGERTPLDAADARRWRTEAERAFAVLDAALGRSCLPEQPPNREELQAWLLELRRAHP
ncbi:MAG: nucleotidyltransferase domain-containing protein [Deltaproteobacteria bacterium]|nr:nucleotidyltransferase domain-containing protein [Deltaproteobacteria bacterium]